MKKYGLVVGRYQPLHAGHMAIMNQMLDNNYIPIIAICSSNRKRDVNKNPLNFEQRKTLWELAYPNVKFNFVRSEDYDSDEEWVGSILSSITTITGNLNFKEITLFTHNKSKDKKSKYNYRCMPIWFDSDMFKYEGLRIISLPETVNHIKRKEYCATDIRHDFAGERCSIHPAVYKQLIEWNWK